MLKCMYLSLVFLLGVTSLPLEGDTPDTVPGVEVVGVTESEVEVTTKFEDITPEETTYSQLLGEEETSEEILDNEEVELSTSSSEILDEHVFLLEEDSEGGALQMEAEEMPEEIKTGRKLESPDPEKCATRPNHFSHRGHQYWFSGNEAGYENTKVDWLEARNICRKYCMDLVSIETPGEHNLIAEFLTEGDLPYTWTSGRLCNFKGCDREDLQPVSVAGWFWSGSGVRIAPTNSTPPFWGFQPWSHTGHKSQFFGRDIPQPDNAEEEINGSTEACMAVFNDIYDDGVAWHDVACYHKKLFICEDEEDLLQIGLGLKP